EPGRTARGQLLGLLRRQQQPEFLPRAVRLDPQPADRVLRDRELRLLQPGQLLGRRRLRQLPERRRDLQRASLPARERTLDRGQQQHVLPVLQRAQSQEGLRQHFRHHYRRQPLQLLGQPRAQPGQPRLHGVRDRGLPEPGQQRHHHQFRRQQPASRQWRKQDHRG